MIYDTQYGIRITVTREGRSDYRVTTTITDMTSYDRDDVYTYWVAPLSDLLGYYGDDMVVEATYHDAILEIIDRFINEEGQG